MTLGEITSRDFNLIVNTINLILNILTLYLVRSRDIVQTIYVLQVFHMKCRYADDHGDHTSHITEF